MIIGLWELSGDFHLYNFNFSTSPSFPYIHQMEGLDIVMVIAIILFARLGVRLVTMAIKNKKENKDEDWSLLIRFTFLKIYFFS